MKRLLIVAALGLLASSALAADNYTATPGSGLTFGAKDNGSSVLFPRVIGCDNTTTTRCWTVDANGNLVVSQATAANLNATVVGTGTFAVQLTGATNNINNISGTVSLPTGAATAAKQPALGTAGTASTDVLTIQGIASMTKLLVTPDANSAVNVAQVNGGTVATGSGVMNSNTQRMALATDSPGIVTLGGATPANSVPVVSAGYSYANILTATTTTVKSGAGVLHSVCLNTINSTSTAQIYDNTAGSGTKIGLITQPSGALPNCLIYDVAFATGLTIVTTTGTPDYTVSYR